MKHSLNSLIKSFPLLLTSLTCFNAHALDIPIAAKGTLVTKTFAANEVKSTVRFTFPVTGNISEAIDLYAEGPQGASVSVKAYTLGTKSEASALTDTKGWFVLPMTADGITSKNSFSFARQTPAATPVATPPPPTTNLPTLPAGTNYADCTNLNAEQISSLRMIYQLTLGLDLTVAQLCGTTTPANGTGTESSFGNATNIGLDNQAIRVTSILSKDACAKAAKSKYLVAVEYTLSGVSADVVSRGVTLGVTASIRKHEGSKASTIKPVSDGKFAPNPLLLMSTLGSGAREKVRVLKWSKGKVKSAKELKIHDYIFYRGLMLTRSVVGGVLKGGKGTFEISDGVKAYGVCFALKKSRQRANGYTN
jgi:hypothetical protein